MGLQSPLHDVEALKAAIDGAQRYADNKGVPLTLERLAVYVGVNRHVLADIVAGNKTEIEGNKITQETIATLKKAVDSCVAAVMEHGMRRGNSPIMPIFALKCNHNYDDHPQQTSNAPTIVIVGADKIPD